MRWKLFYPLLKSQHRKRKNHPTENHQSKTLPVQLIQTRPFDKNFPYDNRKIAQRI
ncbi:MAG: hypothetical protein GXO75_15250 [Calditrichaeota bacterium]|nr:hypothetical protein [Calditrichota bacterium]